MLNRWGQISGEQKRAILDDKASYELFLFLKFADRAFFDTTVAPMLRMRAPCEVDVMTMILLEDAVGLARAFADMHVVSRATTVEGILAAAVMQRKDMLRRIALECSGSLSDRKLEQWCVPCSKFKS